MSISTPPPPAAPKKRGLGCLGCGCLFLVLLVLLFVAFVGGAGYFAYQGAKSLSATKPIEVATFNGSDDQYQATRQKISDFDHDVKNHQATSLTLSADEINTMISRTPGIAASNVHAYLTMTGSEARLQASIPTDALSQGAVKGRYFNFDASFGIHFDQATKSVSLDFHTLTVNDKAILGGSADGAESAANSQAMQAMIGAYLNQSFNAGLRKNTDAAALLDQAKDITIKDGQLVIETQ